LDSGKSGQASLELVAIIIVVLLLLLIVSLTIVQKNFFTSLVSNVNGNTQQCNAISGIIANFQSNPGYSETKITPDYYTRIEKNNIRVGPCQNCGDCICNTCNYREKTRFQDGASSYITDSTGFSLSSGVAYKVKKIQTGVVFCDAANAWC
jgi:hypothetical protein